MNFSKKLSLGLCGLIATLTVAHAQPRPIPRPIPLPTVPPRINLCALNASSYECVLEKYDLKERDTALAPFFSSSVSGQNLKKLAVLSIFGSPSDAVQKNYTEVFNALMANGPETFSLIQDSTNKLPAQFKSEKEFLSQLVARLNLSQQVKANYFLAKLQAAPSSDFSAEEVAASKLGSLELAELNGANGAQLETAVQNTMGLNLSPVAKQVVLKRYESINAPAARRIAQNRGVVLSPNRRIRIPTRPIN